MRASSSIAAVGTRAIPALLLIAVMLVGWPAGAGASSRTGASYLAGAPQWRIGQAPLPPEVDAVPDLSCGSQSLCLAIGFTAGLGTVLLRSTDGGLRWAELQEPAQLGAFIRVSCSTARRCLATTGPGRATAGGVVTTTDGGLTWHADRSFPVLRTGDLATVRCVTASVCYVFNTQASSYLTGGIERTADFGGHWTTEHVSGPHAGAIDYVADASCATASACVAVADWSRKGGASPMLETSDAGRTWTVRTAPTQAQDLAAVSCGSAEDCLAAGGGRDAGPDAVVSSDGGVTWSPATPLPAVGTAWAVTCVAARSCLIVGQAGTGEGNNGVAAKTADLGRHWTATRTAPGAGILAAVSCPSASHCVAGRESGGVIAPTRAGSQGFFLSDNAGASWQKIGLPLALSDLQDVACPTASVCYAAGGTSGPADDAVVLRSGDGGVNWRIVLRTSRIQTLSGISCPTAAQCVAVGTQNYGRGNAIARTYDGGRRWQVGKPPAGVALVTSVSCPTQAFCEAIGLTAGTRAPARLLRSADGGRRWTVSKPPRGVAFLLGLSCPTGRVCTAVGDAVNSRLPAIILRSTDSGLHWNNQRPPPGATILDSVSCPDTTTCDAFSDTSPATIDTTSNGGAGWYALPLRGQASQAFPPSALSCVTGKFCVGVAMFTPMSGAVFETTNGKTWREATAPGDVEAQLGISCTRSGCVAVGLDGQVLLSGGGGRAISATQLPASVSGSVQARCVKRSGAARVARDTCVLEVGHGRHRHPVRSA